MLSQSQDILEKPKGPQKMRRKVANRQKAGLLAIFLSSFFRHTHKSQTAFFRIHSQGKGREFGVSLEDVDLEFMFYGTKSLIMNKNFSSKFKKKRFLD